MNTKKDTNLVIELREKEIPVNGTLDAVVHFLREEYDLSEEDSAKAALLLLIAQEAGEGRREFSALARYDKSNIDAFFDESRRAKGLIGSLRVSINLTEAKIQILKAIPLSMIKWTITRPNFYEGLSDAFVALITILLNNSKFIKVEHTCICCTAWTVANNKEDFSRTFTIKELKAAHKNFISNDKCPFSNKYGLSVRGLSIWRCQFLRNKRTCSLKDKDIKFVLNEMTRLHIIEPTYFYFANEYRFL